MRPRKLHICLTLFAYLFTGGLGGSGTLCIGADGHVELESGDTSCCSVENDAASTDESDPCGPCFDIPLLKEHIRSAGAEATGHTPASGLKQPLLSSVSMAADISATRARPELNLINPGEISSAHLQSTILLC